MRKRIRSLVALGAIALAISGVVVTSVATAQPPSTQGGGTFDLVNRHSGKCLEIAFEGTADFSGANQYQCTGRANQRWSMIFSPNPVILANGNSGKCLEIGYSGLWDFNAANQHACTGGRNQLWQLTGVRGGFALVNAHSGKCLEIAFEGLWDFNSANQYQCTWADNQVWDLRQVH